MPCGPSAAGETVGGPQTALPTQNGADIPPISRSISSNGVGNRLSVISEPALVRGVLSPSLRPSLPLPPLPNHCVHGRPLNQRVVTENVAATTDDANVQDANRDRSRPWWKSWNRKYVLLCGMCGLSSLLLGIFYLTIYLVLRSYTSSLEFFQTMPTYVPASVLIVTGLLVLSFMRRKNRISMLIKIVGFLCLVCAVICVVVTVTTTVLHMNRLQTLRECTFYTQLHSCTCLPFTEEEPFELKLGIHITNCDVIHGPLYSCLRAMFGVSVIGILVSIFSCMLVYQLLSHEKKKMYWEQLESRRQFLYRRTTGSMNNNCNCCDEYGFVSPTELYPWRIWDSMDERYWPVGTPLYSPGGDESSNASRSVLLTGNTSNGTPSLLLPWGGTWRNSHPQAYPQGTQMGDLPTPSESTGAVDQENAQIEQNRARSSGVVLRPFIPRGLESRFGLRRHPPPTQPSHSRRPLSDPGIAFQLPRYPPPFSEAFLPPIPYEGLEAFSRLMWDPPPPYSQPTSQENLPSVASMPQSPVREGHHAIQLFSTPHRRPQGFPNFRYGNSTTPSTAISSPTEIADQSGSPLHLALLKSGLGNFDGTGSLPLNSRVRCLPLGHVKSLGDVTEATRESLEVLFGDGKEISSIDKFGSHGDVTRRMMALKTRHMKSDFEPRVVYSKGEQESELYFADVSSCVSLRQDHKDDNFYGTAEQKDSSDDKKDTIGNHVYEQVRHQGGEEDNNSNHNSDDTVIVHTSSSDHSLTMEGDNTYSVISPLTDQSSASPMATDTDAYSSYQAPTSKGQLSSSPEEINLNLHSPHRGQHIISSQVHYSAQFPNVVNISDRRVNDNENTSKHPDDHCYEAISTSTTQSTTSHPSFATSSDLNGNVSLSADLPQEAKLIHPSSSNDISFAARRPVPLSYDAEEDSKTRPTDSSSSPSRASRRPQDKSSPSDRRLQSVQERLFSLKSVNV